MLDIFEVFDFANPNLVSGNRNSSTLPTQALYLMNSPVVIERARKAALRLCEREFPSEEHRLRWVYQQVLGREPSYRETEETFRFLSEFQDEQVGWASVYHALFASLEFRYFQ